MKTRIPLIVSAILIVCMVGASVWALGVLPSGKQVAIHWGPGGVPNNFASIPVALSIGPLIALMLSTAFAVIWLTAVAQDDRIPLPAARLFVIVVWIAVVTVVAVGHATIIYSAISDVHGSISK
jgi:uncharacterized membrane protein